jgi:hypothetical protein
MEIVVRYSVFKTIFFMINSLLITKAETVSSTTYSTNIMRQWIHNKFQQHTSQNHRTRNRGLNMSIREPGMNYKYLQPNQKGKNYTDIK